MARNAPPKAETETCALVRTREYWSGSLAAMISAESGSMRTMTATISRGNAIRIPNTATAIPQVMKRRRHTGAIFFNTTAFTTALSNDRDISRIASTATMNVVVKTPVQLCVVIQPRKAPRASPAVLTKKELRK